jgi:hypothetical protein
MSRNPIYNALAALAYIVGLVTLVSFGPLAGPDGEDSVLMPMAVLSVLVLSASLMVYLFFYQPLLLLLDGQREQAVKLFLQTVGIFASGTVLLVCIAAVVS